MASSKDHMEQTHNDLNKFQVTPNHGSSERPDETITDKDMVVAREHNRALYVTAKINGFDIQWALMGIGSFINVMPLSTFKAACIPEKHLVLETLSITGVSGTGNTLGYVMVDLQVGPIRSETCFHVMDANLPCDVLLGRPWICKFEGVADTYHQCFKGKFQGKEVVIKGSLTPLPDAFYVPFSSYCEPTRSPSSASS